MPFGSPQEHESNSFISELAKKRSFFRRVPIGTFKTWKYYQDDRNKYVGRKPDIDLSNERHCVYLHVKTIEAILAQNPPFIVTRFICEGAPQLYSNLSVVFCGMDNTNIVTDVYETHFITNPDINAIDNTTTNWGQKATNFSDRNNLINQRNYSRYFKNEFQGIAHPFADFKSWFDEEIGEGMKEVALYPVKDPQKTTVVYVNSEFGGQLLADIDLYDFGQACCPPQ